MCHYVVESSVVSIRQLYHHRIRREWVVKLSNLQTSENSLRGGAGYIFADELETAEGDVVFD